MNEQNGKTAATGASTARLHGRPQQNLSPHVARVVASVATPRLRGPLAIGVGGGANDL